MHHKLFTLFTRSFPVHFFVPKTHLEVIIYPTQIEIGGQKFQVLSKGLVEKFQAYLDLKQGFVEVKGFVEGAFFNYQIIAEKNSILLKGKKNIKSQILVPKAEVQETIKKEKLHFGVFKKMQIERIFERLDLKEIIPIWFRLGSFFPKVNDKTLPFFERLEELKIQKKHEQIGKELLYLFRFLFPNRFMPQSEDIFHQGFRTKEFIKSKYLNFLLLQKSAEFIRSLFIEEKNNSLFILSHLLPEFPFATFEEIETSFGHLNLRVSKKKPFTLQFLPRKKAEITFNFPIHIKSCRIRNYKNQRGKQVEFPLTEIFEKDQPYLFDRFEK